MVWQWDGWSDETHCHYNIFSSMLFRKVNGPPKSLKLGYLSVLQAGMIPVSGPLVCNSCLWGWGLANSIRGGLRSEVMIMSRLLLASFPV